MDLFQAFGLDQGDPDARLVVSDDGSGAESGASEEELPADGDDAQDGVGGEAEEEKEAGEEEEGEAGEEAASDAEAADPRTLKGGRVDPSAGGRVDRFGAELVRRGNAALVAERMKLPVIQHARKIVQCLRHSDSIVIVGETGSGKTTREF